MQFAKSFDSIMVRWVFSCLCWVHILSTAFSEQIPIARSQAFFLGQHIPLLRPPAEREYQSGGLTWTHIGFLILMGSRSRRWRGSPLLQFPPWPLPGLWMAATISVYLYMVSPPSPSLFPFPVFVFLSYSFTLPSHPLSHNLWGLII